MPARSGDPAAVAALGLAPDHVRFLRLPDRFVPSRGPGARRRPPIHRGGGPRLPRGRPPRHLGARPPSRPSGRRLASPRARRALPGLAATPIRSGAGPSRRTSRFPLPPPRGLRLDIAAHRHAKQAAIAEHRSQATDLIDDDPEGLRLEPAMLARFAGRHEIFLAIPPETEP